jgi:translocation and assembly module TamB
VRGPELDTEWKGDLNVGGTSLDPILTGRLQLVRGSFRILNVRLEAVKGTIIFDGGDEIDPLIEIVGETEKNDVVARVTVSGRALAPEIAFSSEPPLPQDEILARLLFGKTPTELSAVESVQLAAAVARLARGGGGGGLDPVGWLRETLNVDTLDVTSAEGTEGGSVLSVGKYVTEDVFVSLNQGLTDNTSSASVEVELTDNLTLESEVGRDAEGSLGLNWKWDY